MNMGKGPKKTLKMIMKNKEVLSKDNEKRKLKGNIGKEIGKTISKLIRNKRFEKTLEIGCAYGISSLYICAGLLEAERPSHTIVDPLQNKKWEGIGLNNLDKSGIKYYRFIDKGSEIALPELLKKEESFDFILVDGWHSFDQTMIDLFYSTSLLRVGGILAIDDVNHPSVNKAFRFFSSFPCYSNHEVKNSKSKTKSKLDKLIGNMHPGVLDFFIPAPLLDRLNFKRFVALKKTENDNHHWKWLPYL